MLNVPPNSCAVLGQCMGSAMAMRAVESAKRGANNTSPFSGHFVFHNATAGNWVEEMTELVDGGRAKILAWHEVDPDHLKEAVAYKNLSKLADKHPDRVTLIDNDVFRANNRTDVILETNSVRLPKTLDYVNPRSAYISYKDPTNSVIARVVR